MPSLSIFIASKRNTKKNAFISQPVKTTRLFVASHLSYLPKCQFFVSLLYLFCASELRLAIGVDSLSYYELATRVREHQRTIGNYLELDVHT